MNNEENINIQNISGANIPEDAVFYKNCNCHFHSHPPIRLGILNTETHELSITFTGEL